MTEPSARFSACLALVVFVGTAWIGFGCGSRYEARRIRDPGGDLFTERVARGPDGVKHQLSGKASWYGKKFQGRQTASGEAFDMYAFTAAHRTLPFHTIVRVLDPETNKSVVVRINDRGPYSDGRVIDLSYAAAVDLDMFQRGVMPVEIVVLQWGDGSRVSSSASPAGRSSPFGKASGR